MASQDHVSNTNYLKSCNRRNNFCFGKKLLTRVQWKLLAILASNSDIFIFATFSKPEVGHSLELFQRHVICIRPLLGRYRLWLLSFNKLTFFNSCTIRTFVIKWNQVLPNSIYTYRRYKEI